MISEKKLLSALRLKNLYFESIHFESTGKKVSDEKGADVGFKLDEPIIMTDEEFGVKLRCKITSSDSFRLDLCLAGVFQMVGDDKMEKYFPNAVAIMFPYLRSQVSLLTAQPNIPTIILPPINVNKLINCMETQAK